MPGSRPWRARPTATSAGSGPPRRWSRRGHPPDGPSGSDSAPTCGAHYFGRHSSWRLPRWESRACCGRNCDAAVHHRGVRAYHHRAGPGCQASFAGGRLASGRAAGLERRRPRLLAGGRISPAAPGGHRPDPDRSGTMAQRPPGAGRDGVRAVPPAGEPGRGRAPLRDRGRAGGDSRGPALRPAASARHHGAGHGRAHAGAGRARGAAPHTASRDAAAAYRCGGDARRNGIPPGPGGHRGGPVQRAGRDRRRLRLRYGRTGPVRMVGR